MSTPTGKIRLVKTSPTPAKCCKTRVSVLLCAEAKFSHVLGYLGKYSKYMAPDSARMQIL